MIAQRRIVGGDVLLAPGKALLRRRELVHQGEADVVFAAGKVDGGEPARKRLGGFPANLPAQTRFVTGGQHAGQFLRLKNFVL